jgi:hypothetical protein
MCDSAAKSSRNRFHCCALIPMATTPVCEGYGLLRCCISGHSALRPLQLQRTEITASRANATRRPPVRLHPLLARPHPRGGEIDAHRAPLPKYGSPVSRITAPLGVRRRCCHGCCQRRGSLMEPTGPGRPAAWDAPRSATVVPRESGFREAHGSAERRSCKCPCTGSPASIESSHKASAPHQPTTG